jgi:hypothetical protein
MDSNTGRLDHGRFLPPVNYFPAGAVKPVE